MSILGMTLMVDFKRRTRAAPVTLNLAGMRLGLAAFDPGTNVFDDFKMKYQFPEI